MDLPNSHSPNIRLSHPTPSECRKVWELTAEAWSDALTLPLYLEESSYLTTVPLAKNGGMTNWILTDNGPADQRPIFSSCETFRKRAFLSTGEGELTEKFVHGIASVFCDPAYRNRGYATRLLKELSRTLPTWQSEEGKPCIGSILYSDIGRNFYAQRGWHPSVNNSHLEFAPSATAVVPSSVKPLRSKHLSRLCQADEVMIRISLLKNSRRDQRELRMAIVPDLDHMLWHHTKEEFVCRRLFGKRPRIKGAIAGRKGKRVWALWTHRYYGDIKSPESGNTLYILRLVIESGDDLGGDPLGNKTIPLIHSKHRQVEVKNLRAVIRAAQVEAAKWKLGSVIMWNPTRLAQALLDRSGIECRSVDREDENIASLSWFGPGGGNEDSLDWVLNEKFAWC